MRLLHSLSSSLRYLAIAIAFFPSTLALTSTASNSFLVPPAANAFPNLKDFPKYVEGTTINIQWSTDFETIDLGLRLSTDPIILIDGRKQGDIIDNKTNPVPASIPWTVTSPSTINLAKDNTFYLSLLSSDKSQYFTTNYFLIIPNDTSTTSSSSSLTTFSTSATTSRSSSTTTTLVPANLNAAATTSSSATASPTSLASNSISDNNNNGTATGLSDAGKVGFGIGVPLAVALLAFIAWLVWRQRRKIAARAQDEKGSGSGNAQFQTVWDPLSGKVTELQAVGELGGQAVSEIDGRAAGGGGGGGGAKRWELPGS